MSHLLADTFFSALCHGWINLYGEADLTTLLEQFKTGNLPWRMSDGFPYQIIREKNDAMPYLPKPMACDKPPEENKSDSQENSEESSKLKKELKKIRFLQCCHVKPFIQKGFDEAWFELYKNADDLWETEAMPQVSVSRTGGEDAEPFQVNYLQFKKDSGLWIVFQHTENSTLAKLKAVVEHLGEDIGIGGEKSTGAGRFTPEWSDAANDNMASKLLQKLKDSLKLEQNHSGRSYLLSLCNPAPGEVSVVQHENSRYQIIDRKGFHASWNNGWPGPVKKKPVGMLTAGSVLDSPIQGRLVDVTPTLDNKQEAPHPLYRYGIALTAGV
jgi:CRISPR-associated protein Csm4